MRQTYRAFLLATLGLALPPASHAAAELPAEALAVKGTVSGLSGPGLVLQYNGGATLPIDANGAFSFDAGPAGGDYEITILAQPAGSLCNATENRGRLAADRTVLVKVDCIPAHTIGGTVAGLLGAGLSLRNNGKETIAVDADGGFAFPAAQPAGSAYSVTIVTQPDQSVCAVGNGAGRVGIDNVTRIAVTCRTNALGFAYVLDSAAKSIFTFRIDAANGALTATGAPVPAGQDPLSLTIDPLGRFAYVANYGSNDILVYRIDRATGALTAAGAPITLGAYPISIALDPAGVFAYVANSGSNSVGVYRVDPASGALTAAGAPVAAGAFPIFVTLDPAGRHAYVVNYGSDTVSVYRVDAGNGGLSLAGTPVATGAYPFSITMDPAGRFAYVANSGANSVSSYRIDAASGALTATGSPAAAGADPQFISVDPGGRFAYVTNYSSDNVSVYRIDAATGALKAAGPPVAAGGIPISISMDPAGRFAYVATAERRK
ncbi:MAG: beta-propeller fold lactonase family protein [Gammaproteobacteria bacterium]|nr:beta-propeller fold lactonase family protein [Gammaproteobacteria bacterium]